MNHNKLIVAMLYDVFKTHDALFKTSSRVNTIRKVQARLQCEGISFLTKTLPRLGKAFDKALTGSTVLNSANHGWKTMANSELPRFLGELFSVVFHPSGVVLHEPCVQAVSSLRQILYPFYKYELPYSHEQEQEVLSKFEETEKHLQLSDTDLEHYFPPARLLERVDEVDGPDVVWLNANPRSDVVSVGGATSSNQLPCGDGSRHLDTGDQHGSCKRRWPTLREKGWTSSPSDHVEQVLSAETSGRHAICCGVRYVKRFTVLREARILLYRVLASLDLSNIRPRHGPGAVSTRQVLWDKYVWTNVSSEITRYYPLDAYFCASLGHVCDSYQSFSTIDDKSLPARVILVPKDSRGPRLISCEPVDNQWIQQGISRAIVSLVENHSLTRDHVFFTDQEPNQQAALWGSFSGGLATLDLNEASDRVSLELVRLLFPPHIRERMECCRSSCTVLPDGRELHLRKFAPMGSALCFPVMALTIWSLLTAAAPDRYTQERILVYGDDVIVPTEFVEDAMSTLESVGLKINRDKSCTSGFFRESCGTDAFKGVNVTPVRFRTVWTSYRSPDSYVSWIAYANHLYSKGFKEAANYIAGELHALYGAIPDSDTVFGCPSLFRELSVEVPRRSKWNHKLQRREWYVWDIRTPVVRRTMPGWLMLLRYFTEQPEQRQKAYTDYWAFHRYRSAVSDLVSDRKPMKIRNYTRRRSSKLALCWR